jgi:NAD(P)-dependent dehydrogenase (short-subunit alcohol dehydrogenase family)
MNEYTMINRESALFTQDYQNNLRDITDYISKRKILVIGAAGSIGRAVTRELLKFGPKQLDAIDISENNLVELVRQVRSSTLYIADNFRTFCLDVGSLEFEAFIEQNSKYDLIYNLSAMKHVRSERDPFTLMRMLQTNIFYPRNVFKALDNSQLDKYFCVSTDKAANPVNFMGASKRIMEYFLTSINAPKLSMARFANVAFSDGSLLHGFYQRLNRLEPISAPMDICRYFITDEEAARLCLLSSVFGSGGEIYFPAPSAKLNLTSFRSIATNFLEDRGYTPFECESEAEAKSRSKDLIRNKQWPCYFFYSDTAGEKTFEEFYEQSDEIYTCNFDQVAITKPSHIVDESLLTSFEEKIGQLRRSKNWSQEDIKQEFTTLLPTFEHNQKNKNLDQRM